MDIADVPAALKKVQSFIVVLRRGQQEWSRDETPPYISDYRNNDILERLPLIVRIAARVDAELAVKLQEESDGWPYDQTLKAAQQLAGLLKATEDAQQILGPVGPKLAAANLHPWIWDAAGSLWDDGHMREAVQAAAVALFDHHLPAKLEVAARSAADLVTQAFSADPPTATHPRLRLADYPDTFRQQADYLTPARPGICHVDVHYEVRILAGKRGTPLGYKKRLKRRCPHLFCCFPLCDSPQALTAFASLALGRIALDVPRYRVIEDRGQR